MINEKLFRNLGLKYEVIIIIIFLKMTTKIWIKSFYIYFFKKLKFTLK